MAYLWVKNRLDSDAWAALPLQVDRYMLTADAHVLADIGIGCDVASARLVRTLRNGGDEVWSLLTRPVSQAVYVNGLLIRSGIRTLCDRDEIRFEGYGSDAASESLRYFFTTERLPNIETFPGPDPVICPRCKTAINQDDSAVKCPGCAVWHHQTDERPCWTGYVGEGQTFVSCALGDYAPAALYPDADFRWSPEGL